MMQWVKAAWWRGTAILVCFLTLFTACSDNDEKTVTPVFKPDDTVLEIQDDEVKEQLHWYSTFADTYEQTAFDKATGWSRWIKANKQRPAKMSAFTEGYTPY